MRTTIRRLRGTDAGRDMDESKSGKPQRLTASGLVPAKHVLFAAMICAAIACICGVVAVVLAQAWWLLAVGAASLLAGWFYTGGKHPYGYVGLGEVGVFLFFGLAAVLGTEYALCGTVDVGGLLGAVAAGLFSCLIIMVNNIRDIDEDREHGKHTLAVRLGGVRRAYVADCVLRHRMDHRPADVRYIMVAVGCGAVALGHRNTCAHGLQRE